MSDTIDAIGLSRVIEQLKAQSEEVNNIYFGWPINLDNADYAVMCRGTEAKII